MSLLSPKISKYGLRLGVVVARPLDAIRRENENWKGKGQSATGRTEVCGIHIGAEEYVMGTKILEQDKSMEACILFEDDLG